MKRSQVQHKQTDDEQQSLVDGEEGEAGGGEMEVGDEEGMDADFEENDPFLSVIR